MRWAKLGFALFAGCVIGWWWSDRPDFARSTDLFQVLTALGTLTAASVAVWSSKEAHKREDMRVERERATKEAEAKIIALQAFSWASACSGIAERIANLLAPAQKSIPVSYVSAKKALELADEALEFLDRIPELHLLSYLPERCGERVAYGYGQLVYIQRALKNELAEPCNEFPPYWKRGAMLSLMSSEASNFFRAAATQIQNFALTLPIDAPARS